MEPESSLPHLQEPTICPHPESQKSSPCPPPHFLKVHFDIIFPSTPRSSKWPLSLRSPDQNPLLSPICATCPSRFDHPNDIHVPDLKSPLRRVCFVKGSVQVRGLSKCLVTSYVFTLSSFQHLAQPPSWRTTACLLSATVYSIYSQLSSISGSLSCVGNVRTPRALLTVTH